MKHSRTNVIVDAVAFTFFVTMTTTGMVMRWLLPPGAGRLELLGRGRHRQVLTLWGLDRHQWGDIHFWLAVALLVTLVLHVVLHWRWIVAKVRGKRSEASGMRLTLGVFALAALLAMAFSPLLCSVEPVTP